MKKVVIALVVTCLLSFTIFSISMANVLFSEENRNSLIEKNSQEFSFPVSGIESINLQRLGSTRINVVPTDSDTITAKLETQYLSSGSLPELKATSSSNTVDIRVEHKPKVGIVWFVDTELTVHIPRTFTHNLSINATSGSVSVTGLALNQFSYSSMSGSLRTEALTAKLADISCTSGTMRLYQFAGNLKATALSGNIHVEYKELGKSQATLFASSGDITLRMPEGAGYVLDASTSSGRISTYFPVSTNIPNRVKADVGSGEGSVTVQTRSGKINITR